MAFYKGDKMKRFLKIDYFNYFVSPSGKLEIHDVNITRSAIYYCVYSKTTI